MEESKSNWGWYVAGFIALFFIVAICVRVTSDMQMVGKTLRDLGHVTDKQPNDLPVTLPQLDQMFKANANRAEATLSGKDVVINGKIEKSQPSGEDILVSISNAGSKSRAIFTIWAPDEFKSAYKPGGDLFCRGTFKQRDKSGDYEFDCLSSADSDPGYVRMRWFPSSSPKPHKPPKVKTNRQPMQQPS